MSIIPGTHVSQHTLRTYTHPHKPPATHIMQQRNLEGHNARTPYKHSQYARECSQCHTTAGTMIATHASRTHTPASQTFICTQCANEDIDGRRIPFSSDRVYKSTAQIASDFDDALLDAIIARHTNDGQVPNDLIDILRERIARSETPD